MNWFQIVGLAVLAFVCLLMLYVLSTGKARFRTWAIWLLVFAGAGLAIARPELTKLVANMMGIGRGADLILYSSVIIMLVGFFWVMLKFRRLERNHTKIVRDLALKHPISAQVVKEVRPDDRV